MRVLFDEMVPRRLRRLLPTDTQVTTVRERGWGLLKNGDLLEVAQREFDVLLTMDKGIPLQQNLSRFDLSVVILRARSNRYADLAPLAEKVSTALSEARRGEPTFVEADKPR